MEHSPPRETQLKKFPIFTEPKDRVKFEVLTAVKVAMFWVVTLCRLQA
jgi:hypothetical protein